ncbi:MAG TPA: hypothetical protein VFE97_21875 [Methylomirabilota bacterium]|nr:hypothetical protein [Methylomirabilota bacterium]
MIWDSIRVAGRTTALLLSFAIGLPTLAAIGIVALPSMLVFAIPGRYGFGTLRLGRFGTLTFGASDAEKAQMRAKLALLRRDLKRLRHPVSWPN